MMKIPDLHLFDFNIFASIASGCRYFNRFDIKGYITMIMTTLFLIFFSSDLIGQQAQKIVKGTPLKNGNFYNNEFIKKTQKEPSIYFGNTRAEIKGDSLEVSFVLRLCGKLLHSGDGLYITPVYSTDKGILRFPSIIVNGKKRSSYYRRERALSSHEKYIRETPYEVIEQPAKGKSLELIYKWRESLLGFSVNGFLQLEQQIKDCCNLFITSRDSINIIRKSGNNFLQENNLTFIEPAMEMEKKRTETFMVRINFPVDRYEVLPYFMNNRQELDRIGELIRPLSNKDYQLREALILGYASPEGSFEYNKHLSGQRSESFKNYLITHYGFLKLPKFYARGMGEDWDGLEALVTTSDMPYKYDVLRIISNYGVFDGREKRLMDLAGGEAYRYMYNNFFSPLRRMEMRVEYIVRPYQPDEAERVFNNRPKDLSQQELFNVARRRNSAGHRAIGNDYGREYDIAVKYFPDNDIALVNASSAALLRNDLDQAYSYLMNVKNKPDAYNNLGVYYLLKGDFIKAEDYLLKAMSIDPAQAKKNLEILYRIQENQKKKLD